MPFDRAGLLPAQISPWAHINNFRPASEMRNGQRSWGRVQAQNSRNKTNMAKQKVITFAPFIRLATHIGYIIANEWGAYDVENTASKGRRFHPGRRIQPTFGILVTGLKCS